MKKLQQVSDIINKCVSYIGMVIFIILIVACVAQVFFRFILNNSLSWSEELARYCFIWMHMLGASLLIEGSGHATVTAILDLMHGTLRKIVDIIIELVIFFDGTVMLYAGLKLAYSSRTNLSTALSVPMWCINSSVAVGGILLMFQAFVCARIGMDYCKTDRDKMTGGVMAAVLATQGTAWASVWALGVGFGLNLLLSNWKPGQKKGK